MFPDTGPSLGIQRYILQNSFFQGFNSSEKETAKTRQWLSSEISILERKLGVETGCSRLHSNSALTCCVTMSKDSASLSSRVHL